MSAATKPPQVSQQRKPSIIESAVPAGPVSRSAMILTSSVTRDGPASQMAGFYENTYQLKPEQVPQGCQLRKIVQEVLTEQLSDKTYDPSLGDMTKLMAEQMKQRAKSLGVPRYKYVALVVLGPAQRTSAAMGSRCVWSPAFDTFGEYTYRNDTVSATGVIYGLYVE